VFNDPLFWILVLPGLLLGLYAQGRIKLNFARYSQVGTQGGITGAGVARRLLDSQGLQDVAIESTPGLLKDHYDPRSKTLRLSQDVYFSPSVAAAGVAAHEAGHALQDAEDYFPMEARTYIVPIVQFASQVAPWMFVAGLLLQLPTLTWIGIILFGSSSLFAFLTLPVEFNAVRGHKNCWLAKASSEAMNKLWEFRRFWVQPIGLTWLQLCPQSVSGFSTSSFCFSAVARLLLAYDLVSRSVMGH